jgi:hypothetical protein
VVALTIPSATLLDDVRWRQALLIRCAGVAAWQKGFRSSPRGHIGKVGPEPGWNWSIRW